MPQPEYAPVNKGDATSPTASPRLPQHELSSPRLDSPRLASPRLSSPRLSSHHLDDSRHLASTPPPGVFSSAQAYAPLSNDAGRDIPSSPSRPFFPSAHSEYSSRPLSMASSHMLASSEYDSVHQLARYSDNGAYPMQEYHDKEGRSPMSTPGEWSDPRAAGLAKYGTGADLTKKQGMSTTKKWLIFAGVVVALIVIAIAVAIPLLKVHDDQQQHAATVPGTGPGGKVLTSGGNGTLIRMDNGTEFMYLNDFGGEWRSGLTDDGARAQSYTPRLNETWDYVNDQILGVNLGGWLVIEPFIVPSLFEKYENDSSSTYVVDEYTLVQQWRKEGGDALALQNMREHYDTFITEEDFAAIARAGLNWVRLPIGYWAVSKMDNEPFVEGLSWEYFLKAIQWARKYGLRIELDLHAIPGSQNGYNHGGRLGTFNFLNSPYGLVAAQRTLDIIRVFTQFISQPEITKVVPAFGILNEPNLPVGIGMDNIRRFYVETYAMFRNITGTGNGKGPMMVIHDGFMGLSSFTNFLQGGDRIGWDLHPYICFIPPFGPRDSLVESACNGFMGNTDQGLSQFGVTMAGEYSLANNDCGLFLNGPFQGVRFDGTWAAGNLQKQGDCGPFDDWQQFNASTKQKMKDGALAQMQAFRNHFFWTWKIGDSLRTNAPVNPNWSYKLGWEQGWMPLDPHGESQGACSKLQPSYPAITRTALTWASTFADYQTGAASTYAPDTVSYSWPPPSMASSGTATLLTASLQPSYTPTGPPLTKAVPTPTISIKMDPVPTIDPWAAGVYSDPAYVAIAGCNYFGDIFSNATSVVTGWPCGTPQPAQRRGQSNVFQKRLPGQPGPQPTPMPMKR